MTKSFLPHHVAIIPDGNRRWARAHGLSTLLGHQRGFDALRKTARYARKVGIKVMTIWAFSTENWKRSRKEVRYLMDLFKAKIDEYLKEAMEEKIKIIHLGRKDRIDRQLREKIALAEKKTRKFSKYYLGIGLDYGGRDEITRAVKAGGKDFENYLDTKNYPYPDPDLIIRTGGEQRLSGFLLWQCQYAELMFVKKYLPDFTTDEFQKCLDEFVQRNRRFGK